MSGFEACRKIREAWGASLPVIMLTAYGDAVSVRQGYEAGADDFLQKPVDTVALILKVRACLRLKSLHDQLLASREEAQARARDLALLHEIGRDWSLVTEPEAFSRLATARLAGLLGAADLRRSTVYDRETRTMTPVLPVFGLDDEVARRCRLRGRAPAQEPAELLLGPRLREQPRPRATHGSSRSCVQHRRLRERGARAHARPKGQFLGLSSPRTSREASATATCSCSRSSRGRRGRFLRSRQVFDRQRRHAARLERLSALAGEMAAARGRQKLVDLVTARIQKDLGFTSVSFHAPDADGVAAPRWPRAGERGVAGSRAVRGAPTLGPAQRDPPFGSAPSGGHRADRAGAGRRPGARRARRGAVPARPRCRRRR